MMPKGPPNIPWPFPFPVPDSLISGGPFSLTEHDLRVIKDAGAEVERAYAQFRERVGSLSSRYGVGWKVGQITIISDAVLHNARRNALAGGYWPKGGR